MAGSTRRAPGSWLGVLIVAGAAQTQAADQVEEVVVMASPIRDSQAAAIESKRAANNVLDVISSDTIGRFPDQNLADSLGRLPGVAIERDQGQARFINFRGAPFRWTAIAFDGVDVLGAENGRIPRFDSFPSVITSAVEANKAITPDLPGEAVSGFINIKTFDPFDYQGLHLSGEAGLGSQELGDGDVDKYNGRLSWSNDRWGVMVYGSHNLRQQITDNRELDLTEVPAAGGVIVNSLDFRNYRVEREDNAYGGHLEFRPDERSRLFVSSLFTEFEDREERNQYVFDFADEDNPGFGLSGEALTATAGYQPQVAVTRMLEDGEYRNFTRLNTLGADFEMGQWRLETRLAHTETGNSMFLPIPRSMGAVVAASYDVSNVEKPALDLYLPGTTTPTDVRALSFPVDLGLVIDSRMDTESVKLKLDAERDVRLFDRRTVMKVGVHADQREAEGGNVTAVGALPAGLDLAAYATGGAWDSDMDNRIGGFYWDNAGIRDAWEAAGISAQHGADSLVDIEEDIYAAYAMATTDFDWGNVVYGLRAEWTDYRSAAPAMGVDYSDDYLELLPSVHVNIDLAEDLKLRLSGSSGLSRPTYNELRASVSVDPTSRSAVGGNPALDPETAYGADATLEWYFAPASLLSVGAFHREVSDVLYAGSSKVDGGRYLASAAGEQWDLVGYVNGRDGHLSGFELNFIGQATDWLPAPFDGFGVSGNLTVLDSEFETLGGDTFSLPGTSDMIYNASLYYEQYGFSARVNYQWRDSWLSTTEADGLSEYWDEQQRVDLSARYLLPEGLTGATLISVFANVNNLTDEVDVRYAGSTRTPNQVEGYGRHYLVGVRADF